MKWVARSLTSLLNYSLLQMIWWLLRVARACNRALQAPSVVALNKGDFSIVFWPDKPDIPWPRPASQPTHTAKRSTWCLLPWTHSPTAATPGSNGAADGIPQTPSISNFQEPLLVQSKKGSRRVVRRQAAKPAEARTQTPSRATSWNALRA